MNERERKEEQNKRIGWIASVSVVLLMFIISYFIIAWSAPDPPIPEYGIELGFASSAGAVAPRPASASAAASAQETVQTESSEQQSAEEIVEEATEQAPTEVFEDENASVEAEEVESSVSDLPNEPLESTQEILSQDQAPSETAETEVETEEQEVDQRAVMGSSTAEDSSEVDGDGEDETPEIDERAIYGSQGTNSGSSEGASLALSGWVWDFQPDPKDNSDQSGKIVYKIAVDEEGYLVKITPVVSTVSPEVERKYRQAVERLTFSKTADYQAAPMSEGTLTFIIKSR